VLAYEMQVAPAELLRDPAALDLLWEIRTEEVEKAQQDKARADLKAKLGARLGT
jgi:hypothetical protein